MMVKETVDLAALDQDVLEAECKYFPLVPKNKNILKNLKIWLHLLEDSKVLLCAWKQEDLDAAKDTLTV